MEPIILHLIYGILIGFFIGLICFNTNKTLYFNSNKNRSIDNKRFYPEFEIIHIDKAEDESYNIIAKYTVINSFFAKKNNNDFKYQKFYFYDLKDKYQIGDTITFTNKY